MSAYMDLAVHLIRDHELDPKTGCLLDREEFEAKAFDIPRAKKIFETYSCSQSLNMDELGRALEHLGYLLITCLGKNDEKLYRIISAKNAKLQNIRSRYGEPS